MPDAGDAPRKIETVSDLRHAARERIETTDPTGKHPLRKFEKHRVYHALTGETLDDPSNGEVSFRLIEHLKDEHDLDAIRDEPGREPWDHGGPLTKAELRCLVDALASTTETESDPDV